MSAKRYIHACGHGYLFAEKCTECGEQGTYDGWDGLMHDRMAAYARVRGLKPIGPHRPLTDELFKDAFLTCVRCEGRGYLPSDADHCRPCDTCSACGVVLALPQEEIAALRARVLEAFPDAAHGLVPVEGPFIQKVATGEMISVNIPRPRKPGKASRPHE
jgi:hypothetical protein